MPPVARPNPLPTPEPNPEPEPEGDPEDPSIVPEDEGSLEIDIIEDLQASGGQDLPGSSPLADDSELPVASGDNIGDLMLASVRVQHDDYEGEIPTVSGDMSGFDESRGQEFEPEVALPSPSSNELNPSASPQESDGGTATAQVINTGKTSSFSWAPVAWVGGLIVMLGAGILSFFGLRRKPRNLDQQ